MELILSDIFLTKKAFSEHHQYYYKDSLSLEDMEYYKSEIYFKGNEKSDFCCFKIDGLNKPQTSYFIGIDWLSEKKNKAIYVQPKLNKGNEQLDYVKMLFSLIDHPEALEYVDDIYEIKWDEEYIEIENKQDHLTPLLVVQFLQFLRQIVRKGLKKSYYKVESNLYGKVKGKVMVESTIKHNLVKNKPLNMYCSFDEFGVNGLENRLLKKALLFVQRYLNSYKIDTLVGLSNLFNYINPAFADVSDEVSLLKVKHSKNNAFYKDYETGLKLAKLILRRFGYNITNTQQSKSIKTPPFWIDMSKLFELYVLGILKDEFRDEIYFQYGGNRDETFYGQPDFLLKKEGDAKIIDVKYKKQYQSITVKFDEYLIKDIRQLSGYARDNRIMNFLCGDNTRIIDCIIIYPDEEFLKSNEKPKIVFDDKMDIQQFYNFFKVSIKLPVINPHASNPIKNA
jgi:5-methylcytosine-specific restriction enzyme subunit McrC